MHCHKLFLILLAAAAAAEAQGPTCSVTIIPPIVRAQGETERMGDVVLYCSGGLPGASMFLDLTVELNTNITSRILKDGASASDALLLIDQPSPFGVNMTNGFPYAGQVLGTPGIPAGSPGSGNIYFAHQTSPMSITWTGIPLVAADAGSDRMIQLTNLRADATAVPANPMGQVMATISANVPLTTHTAIAAFVKQGLVFSASLTGSGAAALHFQEGTASAFRKRIENTQSGPFSMARQDLPTTYGNESGFTPCFVEDNCQSPPYSPIGRADTGTLLLGLITRLSGSARYLTVPNYVISSVDSESGPPELAACLVVGGRPVNSPGSTWIPITDGTAQVLYQVVAVPPFSNMHGGGAVDTFTIPAALLDAAGTPLPFPTGAVFAGYLAPLNQTNTASATAPVPRFVTEASSAKAK